MKLLQPKLIQKIWGGEKLSQFLSLSDNRTNIGEALIHDGTLEPHILLKWLYAKESLSIQNHPSKQGRSKREAWYFVESPLSGWIVSGLTCRLESPDIEKNLIKLKVSKDDIVEIPAGVPHSLTKGGLVLEISEPLDCTYRIFDWGRPRELDLKSAEESLQKDEMILHQQILKIGRQTIISRQEFIIEKWSGLCNAFASIKGIVTFVKGRRTGNSYMLDANENIEIEEGEIAVWAGR